MKRTPLSKGSKGLNKTSKLSRGSSTLPRTQIARKGVRIKAKPLTAEKVLEKQQQREKDNEFYARIWAQRGPYSQISGTYLGSEVNKVCCDHLLEKAQYPELRYEPENLLLVTIDEHYLKTNGFPLPRHQQAIQAAKERFLL